MLEMLAVGFDGAHTAERTLSELRSTRTDPWLAEVSVIEHSIDGSYSVKAKNPKIGEGHVASGAAIGGLTGLFIGAIGGPLGLLLWGGLGAMAGAGIGESRESAFKPMVDDLEDALAPDTSMLVLVGEAPTLNAFETTLGADPSRIVRQPLTSEQARELMQARSTV